jgi:hypothetical protein
LYLVGPGKREEHLEPHLVAGADEALRIAAAGMLDQRDAVELARFLDEPREQFGTRVRIGERDEQGRLVGSRDAHVWHCSLSLHPDEPALSDQGWGEICDVFVATTGYAGPDARAQCRWVAIRHGDSAGGSDHVHVVVTLVAEDGSRASVHYDQPRAQNAARELEQRFGLRRLEARSREMGSRGVRAGERIADERRHRDHGLDGRAPERGSRQTLERIVRACASASRDEGEFVRALREHKLRVRPRYAEGGRSTVVGYSVGLPGPVSGPERAIWYGGGRLARDLTLPSLRATWQQTDGEQQEAVREWSRWTSATPRTPEQRHAELEQRAVHWHRCVEEVDRLRRQLRGVDSDPAGSARVAHDAAGILAAWSVALEVNAPGPLARASRQLARSAEQRACERQPPRRPRPHSSMLALYLLAGARPDGTGGWFVLARQLLLLGRDVAELHHLRGEADRARELETSLKAQLEELHNHLQSQLDRQRILNSPRGSRACSDQYLPPVPAPSRLTGRPRAPAAGWTPPGTNSGAHAVADRQPSIHEGEVPPHTCGATRKKPGCPKDGPTYRLDRPSGWLRRDVSSGHVSAAAGLREERQCA